MIKTKVLRLIDKRYSGLLVIAGSLLLFAISLSQPTSHLSHQVIAVNGGYGYNILNKEKVIIHQPSIPSLSGYHPFKMKEDAEAAAKMVIKKIEKGKSPSLSNEDIKTIGYIAP
ncbi:DUF4907 domain-containing protein [Carboxylicivirga sp. N1Y90]|uniref:DUF4907 domain-containing protein n=1 Tax=Carboxylicivirga fragile TaxID=3417571 RepID=UPI003D34E953|nr:DUF4907 domain-containing protein [Marinilabiliaceae bacterium N1Y90]